MSVSEPPPQSGSAVGQTATVIVGDDATTVSSACSAIVPPGPVAVAVNVCEALAVIVSDPAAATFPTPLLIVTVVAFVELQVRIADPPCGTLSGWMKNTRVGTAGDAL